MDSVVVVTVPDAEVGREVVRALEALGAHHGSHLHAAALVERTADGRVTVLEAEEDPSWGATAAGTTIGLVLGVLTGPIGLLVGGATGATVGSLVDIAGEEDSWAIVTSVVRAVPAGKAAVVAVVTESDPGVLDDAATAVGGDVLRRPRGEVEVELAAAERGVLAAYCDPARARRISERLRDLKNAVTGRR